MVVSLLTLSQALSDFRVDVIDMAARRVVRTFGEHTGRITDMVCCFSVFLCFVFLTSILDSPTLSLPLSHAIAVLVDGWALAADLGHGRRHPHMGCVMLLLTHV